MLDTILSTLPSMRKEDIAQVQAMAATLLGNTNNIDKNKDYAEEQLYDSIQKALKRKHIPTHPYVAFKKTTYIGKYRKGVKQVDEFITSNWPELHRSERKKVYPLLIRLIIDDISKYDIPCTVGSVSRHLERAPALFNTAFPNYIESGLQYWVIK